MRHLHRLPSPHFRGSLAALACIGIVACQSCLTREPAREDMPSQSPEPPPAKAPAGESKRETGGALRSLEQPSKDESSGAPAPSAPAPASPSSAPRPAQKARARTGASGAAAESSRRADDADLESARADEPRVLMERLSQADKLGTPDCPSARNRRKAVCDLATQICQLTDRDPNVASVAQYCEDAKERCGEAGRRTAERCER